MTTALRVLPQGRRVLQNIVGISKICHNTVMSEAVNTEKPVEASIRKKLTDTFKPKVLDIVNESYMHNVPKGAETHFRLLVVSEAFTKQPLVQRHRMVNELLQQELTGGVHGLSIVAKTPEQWEESEKKIGSSPPCAGGFGL